MEKIEKSEQIKNLFPLFLGRRVIRVSHSSTTVAIPALYLKNVPDLEGFEIYMNRDLTLTLKPTVKGEEKHETIT